MLDNNIYIGNEGKSKYRGCFREPTAGGSAAQICMEEHPGVSARNPMESRLGRCPSVIGLSRPYRQAGWYRGKSSFVP